MKIFICCSKAFYDQVADIQKQLEAAGHSTTLPNNHDDSGREDRVKSLGTKEYSNWKAGMFRLQEKKVQNNDAILVINLEKKGQLNYIGGATFLEMFKAFELGKKIYLYNPIPEGMLKDEIQGMDPLVINGDLKLISEVAA